jgi:predicted nucleic acid-binding protein
VLVVDSIGMSRLAERSRRAAALIATFRKEGLWPPVVPTVVLAESVSGRPRTDASVDRFLKGCQLDEKVSVARARRAAEVRARAGRGSAVDAVLVALAEPHGTVLTSDEDDLRALAAYADDVAVEVV